MPAWTMPGIEHSSGHQYRVAVSEARETKSVRYAHPTMEATLAANDAEGYDRLQLEWEKAHGQMTGNVVDCILDCGCDAWEMRQRGEEYCRHGSKSAVPYITRDPTSNAHPDWAAIENLAICCGLDGDGQPVSELIRPDSKKAHAVYAVEVGAGAECGHCKSRRPLEQETIAVLNAKPPEVRLAEADVYWLRHFARYAL